MRISANALRDLAHEGIQVACCCDSAIMVCRSRSKRKKEVLPALVIVQRVLVIRSSTETHSNYTNTRILGISGHLLGRERSLVFQTAVRHKNDHLIGVGTPAANEVCLSRLNCQV